MLSVVVACFGGWRGSERLNQTSLNETGTAIEGHKNTLCTFKKLIK